MPLTVAPDDLDNCCHVGEAIAECLRGKNILIAASSDMTHYESQASAEKKDNQAIDAILDLDEGKLAQVVKKLNITMCGFIPVYILLIATKILGAQKCELVEYCTSGDVSGDMAHVVGYAGLVIT